MSGAAAAKSARMDEARLQSDLDEVELKCLWLIVGGLDGKQLAKALGKAPTTVRHYRSDILDKLGADTMPQAVAMAMRRRIIQ